MPSCVANCFTWDQSHKETCTELRRKRFQGYSRSEASSCCRDFFHICIRRGRLLSECQIRFCEALLSHRKAYFSADLFWHGPLSVFRFCMPTRESAGRRRTWRRSLRATRPTVSHTKATSSSQRYITSPPTVRPAPSLCGTSSSRLRHWSVAAATSSATRTTSTKRRMLLLLAKVKYCPWQLTL